MSKGNEILIITVLLEAAFIMLITHYIYIVKNVEVFQQLLPFVNIGIVALTVLIIVSLRKQEENVKRITESRLLKAHLDDIEGLLKSINVQRHEHARHIQTIQSLIYLDEIEESKNYLNGIIDSYQPPQGFVNVGHPVLTALLNSKRKIAETKKINFAFSVGCSLSRLEIESWDLCSILGNIVDNAFDAVTMGDTENKAVSVEVKADNDNYAFCVHNNGPKITKKEAKRLFSAGYTTKNSDARGYGLYLVNKLVDSYKGKIEVVSEGKTTFIIYLPMKGEVDDKRDIFSCCSNNGDNSQKGSRTG